MKKTALAMSVVAALLVSGCDGTSSPAGVGTGSTEIESSAVSETTSREKALSIARQNGMVMEYLVSNLLVDSIQHTRPTYRGSHDMALDSMACKLGLDPSGRAETVASIEEQIGRPIERGEGMDLFLDGTQEDFNTACIAFAWNLGTVPVNGWPRGGDDVNLAKSLLSTGLNASRGMAPIANTLAGMSGASIDELKAEAERLVRLQGGHLRELNSAIYADIVQGNGAGHVTLDYSGSHPAPVHASVGSYDVQGGPAGVVLTKGGSLWYGNGHLEGVRYTVEAVTTNTATMTRSSGSTSSGEQINRSSTSAEARTQ